MAARGLAVGCRVVGWMGGGRIGAAQLQVVAHLRLYAGRRQAGLQRGKGGARRVELAAQALRARGLGLQDEGWL